MIASIYNLSAAVATVLVVSACGSSDDTVQDVFPQTNPDSVVVDPAPELNDPGEYGCDGCPDSEASIFTQTTRESSLTLEDLISDSSGNGEFYVVGNDGSAIRGEIDTSENGNYSLTLPLFCGVQIIKCIWSNEAGRYVLVTEVTRDDCTNADLQLTLNWDDLGQDYELHLVKPGGRINDNLTDCTWTSCINEGPDWGVVGDASDNPIKDVDNVGTFGPENIYLSKPEDGEYTVLVEHWGGGDASSDGNVIFNVAGETTLAEVNDLPSHYVWNVGTITWPSGDVRLNGSIVDCNDNWNSGCQLELPQIPGDS